MAAQMCGAGSGQIACRKRRTMSLNGLNANMVRRWVREADECVPSSAHKDAAAVPAFIQLPMPQGVPPALPPATVQAPSRITVEIRRGSTTVQVKLQMDAHSAAWLREVLG